MMKQLMLKEAGGGEGTVQKCFDPVAINRSAARFTLTSATPPLLPTQLIFFLFYSKFVFCYFREDCVRRVLCGKEHKQSIFFIQHIFEKTITKQKKNRSRQVDTKLERGIFFH